MERYCGEVLRTLEDLAACADTAGGRTGGWAVLPANPLKVQGMDVSESSSPGDLRPQIITALSHKETRQPKRTVNPENCEK